jgi:hypothetical protein
MQHYPVSCPDRTAADNRRQCSFASAHDRPSKEQFKKKGSRAVPALCSASLSSSPKGHWQNDEELWARLKAFGECMRTEKAR